MKWGRSRCKTRARTRSTQPQRRTTYAKYCCACYSPRVKRCLHNGFLATWFGLMIGTFRATAWREFWSFRIFHSAPHCAPRRTRRRMNTGRMRAPPLYRQMRQSCPSIKGASCERAWKDSPPSPVATATAIFPHFFRTDEDLVTREEDRVEPDLGFDDVPLVLFVVDEDRVDDREDERPFCAVSPAGKRSVNASKARVIRRSIYNLLVVANFDCWDYREFVSVGQDKQEREKLG